MTDRHFWRTHRIFLRDDLRSGCSSVHRRNQSRSHSGSSRIRALSERNGGKRSGKVRNGMRKSLRISASLRILSRSTKPVTSRMSGDVSPIERRELKTRSKISNGSRGTIFGDGRSVGARRLRDLVAAIASEAGGMVALAETAQQIVRRLAQVSVELEIMEADRAQGNEIDPVAFCTLVNSQRRLLKDFEAIKRAQKAAAPKGNALKEYLAKKAATANSQAATPPEAA